MGCSMGKDGTVRDARPLLPGKAASTLSVLPGRSDSRTLLTSRSGAVEGGKSPAHPMQVGHSSTAELEPEGAPVQGTPKKLFGGTQEAPSPAPHGAAAEPGAATPGVRRCASGASVAPSETTVQLLANAVEELEELVRVRTISPGHWDHQEVQPAGSETATPAAAKELREPACTPASNLAAEGPMPPQGGGNPFCLPGQAFLTDCPAAPDGDAAVPTALDLSDVARQLARLAEAAPEGAGAPDAAEEEAAAAEEKAAAAEEEVAAAEEEAAAAEEEKAVAEVAAAAEAAEEAVAERAAGPANDGSGGDEKQSGEAAPAEKKSGEAATPPGAPEETPETGAAPGEGEAATATETSG